MAIQLIMLRLSSWKTGQSSHIL